MSKLTFTIQKKHQNARVGEITLNGTTLSTPIFMPVGTKATIKGMILDLLQDPRYIGEDIEPIRLILANTFHLYLRPGEKLVKQAGGLHEFEQWNNLILTDSGGFQVFSLGLGKDIEEMDFAHPINMKLTEEGVHFRSPYDGSKHLFTPENVVDTQRDLGSDIMMVLDVCSPSGASKEVINNHMQMTHRRAGRAYNHFMQTYDQSRGVLFPIVQGGIHHDLREESIAALTPYATDGIAVGGVSVGESKEKIRDVVEFVGPKLPEDKPRYLMGVGTPDDLLHAIEHGFDMFDCVLATRYGRHGIAFSDHGNIKITNAQYKNDFTPLEKTCPGVAKYTKAYLHHLFREKEMLGGILLSLHNIVYLHKMLADWKRDMLHT